MRKFKKSVELVKDYIDFPPELARDLIYYAFIIDNSYPEDENSFVLLLDSAAEIKEAERLYPVIKDAIPEIEERIECRDGTAYEKRVFVLGQDGGGIVLFWIARQANHTEEANEFSK